MKQKTTGATLVTKDDLEKALKNHPTKIDMKLALDELEARMDDRFRRLRNEILTWKDEIVGFLAQMREDRLFEKHEKREIDEQLDDHEDRLKKLEKPHN